jgi:UDP-N-acetylmuramoyl-L-alanyl-D-glutamate--2,6-diaminopimelate ligase
MPKLSRLLEVVPAISARPETDVEISAPVCEDSRLIELGGLFVARPSWEEGGSDGHAFIQTAVARGAAAVVGERPAGEVNASVPYVQVSNSAEAMAWLAAAYEGFPARELVMIGVTGTDGKTTTVSIIHHILKAAGLKAGLVTSVNAILGDEELPTGLHVTTPTAPEVQGYLARMRRAGLTHAVLETTSHGLAQERVTACEFDVAVVTNVTHEHLDFHGSWESYRDAKGRLFKDLMGGARKPGVPKVSVTNVDDEGSASFAAYPADMHLRYSLSPDSGVDLWPGKVRFERGWTRFTLVSPAGEQPVQSRLLGGYNISNILAAASATHAVGIPGEAIAEGIAALEGVTGRMEQIDEGQDFLAIVDFAHTPNSLERVLEVARTLIPDNGRVIVAFGSAGLRDPAKRGMMARIAARLADLTILTAEDPRTASLDDILAEMAEACREEGGIEGETFWRVPDRGEAIYRATQMARARDVILACGKGHEQSMCFGTVEYDWDDREALRSALRGAPLSTLPTAS